MSDNARELPCGAIIDDKRTDAEKAATVSYVIATDAFMSGWGGAPGRSLYAVAIMGGVRAQFHEDQMVKLFEARDEFKRVRTASRIPKLRRGDHLSLNPASAFTWRPGQGFPPAEDFALRGTHDHAET